MTTLGELSNEFTEMTNKHYEEEEKIEAHIDALQEEIERLNERRRRINENEMGWHDFFLKPIAEALIKEYYPDCTYDILGSFGLQSITSIHFYKKGVSEEEKFDGDNCLSITFVPSFSYEDNKEYTHRTTEAPVKQKYLIT